MSEEKENTLNAMQEAETVSSAIASERDQVPPGFWRRSKEAEWYAVHTYSGHEKKVKMSIEKLVENRNMQDYVMEIKIPEEEIVEHTEKGEKSRKRKLYPSYIFIKMIVTNESWYLVRNTQGVTGFVGQGSEPLPLSKEEVLNLGFERRIDISDVNPGDIVTINEGPFKGHTGVVESLSEDKKTLVIKAEFLGGSRPMTIERTLVSKTIK